MSGVAVGYDVQCPVYSPDGKMFQLEYASKPIKDSGLTLGVQCKDGVILAVEKILPSKTMMSSSNQRIFEATKNIGLALAGFMADSRRLSIHAQKEVKNYCKIYSGPICGAVLSKRLAGYIHSHTLYFDQRPFAAMVLIASYDEISGSQLFCLDNSGGFFEYYANAIGKNSDAAKTKLAKKKFNEITCKEAAGILAEIIYTLHDEAAEKQFNLEMSWVGEHTSGRFESIPSDLLEEAHRKGSEAKRRQEQGSDSE